MGMKTRDLLPDYAKDPRWLDMCDAIDDVFGGEFADHEKLLKYIRHQYIPNDVVRAKSEAGEMVSDSDWDIPDRQTAARQTEMSGLRLSDTSYLTAQHFTTINRNVASFWYSKGLFDFVDFIAYCINQRLEMVNMWTRDYVRFVDEDTYRSGERSGLYASVYLGGDWYPTTHVRLRFYPDDWGGTFDDQVLISRLFLDVSNLNLVLQAIEEYRTTWIADDAAVEGADGTLTSRLLYAGAYIQDHYYISQE